MSQNISISKYSIHFSRATIDIKNLAEEIKQKKVSLWKFYSCNFTPKRVDFSSLVNCTRLKIYYGNIEEVVAWPSKIREIDLFDCEQLRKVPDDPAQYRHLTSFETASINLDNWDIDLSQSKGVNCIGIRWGFSNKKICLSEIPLKQNIVSFNVKYCNFIEKSVDFSEFKNLSRIFIRNCDVEHIVAWPPKLRKLVIEKCDHLLSLPTGPEQYQYLIELEIRDVFLPNWNLDFTEAYFLHTIKLYNLLAYNPHYPDYGLSGHQPNNSKTTEKSKSTAEKPAFKIPQNWTRCINLRRLSLNKMQDLSEIPLEFTYNPRLYIEINDCSKIPHINCIPFPLHDCVEINYWDKNEKKSYCKKRIFEKDRKWTPGKTQFLDYIRSVIPKIPSEKNQEYFRNFVKRWAPAIKTKKDYSILL